MVVKKEKKKNPDGNNIVQLQCTTILLHTFILYIYIYSNVA